MQNTLQKTQIGPRLSPLNQAGMVWYGMVWYQAVISQSAWHGSLMEGGVKLCMFPLRASCKTTNNTLTVHFEAQHTFVKYNKSNLEIFLTFYYLSKTLYKRTKLKACLKN